MKPIPHLSRRRQGGSALIMMLGLIAMLLVVSTANQQSVSSLRRELRLVEQRQLQRLSASVTNAPALLPP